MKKYVYIGAVVAILGLVVVGVTQIKSCKHEEVLQEAEKTKQTAILNPAKTTKEIKVHDVTRITKTDGTIEEISRTVTGTMEPLQPRVPSNKVESSGKSFYLTACGGINFGHGTGFSYGIGAGAYLTNSISLGCRYDQLGKGRRVAIETTLYF